MFDKQESEIANDDEVTNAPEKEMTLEQIMTMIAQLSVEKAKVTALISRLKKRAQSMIGKL